MAVDTAVAAFMFVVNNKLYGSELRILWHVGEPLTVPLGFYREVYRKIGELCPPGLRYHFSFQTNGTCLSQEWCHFLQETRSLIGVSIDGPAFVHDKHRVWKNNTGTFERVCEGIHRLRANAVPFGFISVLTSHSLDFPDEIFECLCGFGPVEISFNIEESEGVHTSKALADALYYDRYKSFMRRIRVRHNALQGPRPVIREQTHLENFIRFGQGDRISDVATPFTVLSVDYRGHLSTFSPELITMTHPTYDFVFGNVFDATLDSILENPAFRRVSADIKKGQDLCRASCDYFTLCGGGAPSNKLYENGAFDTTETMHCRTNLQANAEVLFDELLGKQTVEA